MKNPSRVVAASLWAISIVVVASGISLSVASGVEGASPLGTDPTDLAILLYLIMGALGVAIVFRVPGNVVGWLLIGTGLLAAIQSLAIGYADFALGGGRGLEEWGVFAALMPSTLWAPTTFIPLILVFLYFPDGTLPSRRWRYLPWLAIVGIVGTTIGVTLNEDVGEGRAQWGTDLINPIASEALSGMLLSVAFPLVIISLLAAVASLLVRYRFAADELRQQMKLVTFGGALAGLLWIVGGTFYDETAVGGILTTTAAILPVLSIGVAILKYRLFDIDVVISRTLVYGTLALFITVVYVGIVVGAGRLVGPQDEPNTWLGIFATVVVALVFQPLRRFLEKVADRIVFGRRATPYEVLSTFSRGVAAVDPDVLIQIARSLTEGTTAESASIWMESDGGMQKIASYPESSGESRDTTRLSDYSSPVHHRGEQLGLVTLHLAAGQPFTSVDARLLDQVAGGLGLALRNMMLTESLKSRVDQLRESRRRIVAVQDRTRHQLERDLHDGAQQRLVALKIKLGIAIAMAEKSHLDDLETALSTIRADADDTINAVRDFARGIYPPLLEAEGLGPALAAQSGRMPIPVTVRASGLGRYPKEQEATTYFCVLESLQNAMKHSRASLVEVALAENDGVLEFEVRDDGIGFDNSLISASGLTNMNDRLDAVGGNLTVWSRPGGGTSIRGRLPVRQAVAL